MKAHLFQIGLAIALAAGVFGAAKCEHYVEADNAYKSAKWEVCKHACAPYYVFRMDEAGYCTCDMSKKVVELKLKGL